MPVCGVVPYMLEGWRVGRLEGWKEDWEGKIVE